MRKRAILTLIEGSFETGFPVILQISSVGIDTTEIQVSGKLPGAPLLWETFLCWQSAYRQMVMPQSRIKAKKAQITNVSCHQLSCQLASSLNEWLNSGTKAWQKIRDSLQRHLNSSDEVEVLIQTRDRRLRQLPWQIWNFFEHYPHAEVALSTPEYRRSEMLPARAKDKVRILAILGDSTGINVEEDRKYLNQLSAQAQIEFLVEPEPEQLNDRLWSQKWDILFFAGHSSSKAEGHIWLNKTDSITIAQLKYALQKAVANGLRLAILNSCDGLRLAEKLADLQIGQTIVMRELVPDAIAQAFLKYFLTAYVSGQSLYAAVREARNRLLILEQKFPYASWLPVIFTNPAEVPPTWTELYRVGKHCSIPWKNRLCAALAGSLAVTAMTWGIRQLGVLQTWELQSFDRLMQLRPSEPPDPRLLIITVTEADVQSQDPQERGSSSLSQRSLTRLLEKIQPYHPIGIGLDIYRDFPVSPEYQNLITYMQNESFVGVCEVGETRDNPGIRSAPELSAEQLGFSNFPVDRDKVIRRQLLGMAIAPESFCQTDTSFSFRVAQLYLAHEGIDFQRNVEGDLQVGQVVLTKLQSNSGSYQNQDALGYQVLLNYRSYPEVAQQITLGEILNDVNDDRLQQLIANRIVLIGTTAPSFKDYHATPHSQEDVPGVVIHAHAISQILSAIEDGRPLIWWLPNWGEVVWIWSWGFMGGLLGSMFYSTPVRLSIFGGVVLFVLYGSCFVLLLKGGWLPFIPAALSAIGAGAIVVVYIRSNRDRSRTRSYPFSG